MTVADVYESLTPGTVLGVTDQDIDFFNGECELYSDVYGDPDFGTSYMSVISMRPHRHRDEGLILLVFV